MHVIARATMWAKSVAAWKIIVFASSMERAEHVEGMSGVGGFVRVERGPRSEHTGRGEIWHRDSKEPKAILAGVEFPPAGMEGRRCGRSTNIGISSWKQSRR